MPEFTGLNLRTPEQNIEACTTFLTNCIPEANASEIITALRESALEEIPYQDAAGQDKNLPPFDSGHWFRVSSASNSQGWLEFLVKGQRFLQTGFQLLFPKGLLFSGLGKARRRVLGLLVGHYGEGINVPQPAGQMRLFNDSARHCYLAWYKRPLVPTPALVLKVGDRELWGGFSPPVKL